VSRIAWREWPLQLRLPDLGPEFDVRGLNDGNTARTQATQGTFAVRPGSYLLTRKGVTTTWSGDRQWRHITLQEFVAPPDSIDRTYVLHTPLPETSAGADRRIAAPIVSPATIDEARLVYYPPAAEETTGESLAPAGRGQPGRFNGAGPGQWNLHGARTVALENAGGFDFAATIPAADLRPGTLRYHVAIRHGETWTTFPSGVEALPTAWDFYGDPWTVRVLPPDAPAVLFDAARDVAGLTTNRRDVRPPLVPSDRPGVLALQVMATDLSPDQPDHSFRHFFRDQLTGRRAALASARRIVLYGRSATDAPCRVQVALVTTDGFAYGGIVEVGPTMGDHAIAVADLRQVRSPNIPHGYPAFIPFWSEITQEVPLDLNRVESVLVSIGPGMSDAERSQSHGVEIERIWLEQ